MRRANILHGFAVTLAMIVLCGAVRSFAGNFTYADFNSVSGLILKEHARPFEGKLRITPAIGGLGLGGVWLDAKQPVKNGFETTFQIQISQKYSSGADGLAFVIQNGPAPALGAPGHSLGYGGVTNQFVVHFNNYHWEDHPNTGRYDEIAVLTDPAPTLPLNNVTHNVLAAATKNVVWSDGAVHTVRIIYVPGNLQVFLDDLENPLMTVYVNLTRVMDLDDGRAWVGFTAASGADWQNHDLVSWSFDSSGEPNSNKSASQRLSPSTPEIITAPSFLYRTEAAVVVAPVQPLSRDPVFGYALPDQVGLNHGIEASTNLIDWTALTNAHYYFRDDQSTNYPQRFYRFPNRKHSGF